MNIMDLPLDVLRLMFGDLTISIKEMSRFAKVNKQSQEIAQSIFTPSFLSTRLDLETIKELLDHEKSRTLYRGQNAAGLEMKFLPYFKGQEKLMRKILPENKTRQPLSLAAKICQRLSIITLAASQVHQENLKK